MSLLFHYTSVNTSTRARVKYFINRVLMEETKASISINKTVNNLRLIVWTYKPKHTCDGFNFTLHYFNCHGGTTKTISVNDYLLRGIFGILSELINGIIHEMRENVNYLIGCL